MTHDDSQINDTPETELDSFDLTEETEGEELPQEDLTDDPTPGVETEPDFFEAEK
jgi:hypothetical protein